MTRRTLKQFRGDKGPDKWATIKDEFDKFPEAPGDSYKVVAGKDVIYNATPGKSIATGLSTITGFGIGIMTPVTPSGGVFVNCTPTVTGSLVCSTTPVDANISWHAIGL